jgi:ABC-type amino acid transport substrate-binding protein
MENDIEIILENWKVILTCISIIATIIVIWVKLHGESFKRCILFFLELLLILFAPAIILYYWYKLKRKPSSLIKAEFIKYTSFDRWEKFQLIKYGKIDYPPLMMEENNGHTGIGSEIFKTIFKNKETTIINRKDENEDWNNIISDLLNKKFDIIATPIFELSPRLRKISFCSPIFYANIGIYVKKGGYAHDKLGDDLCYEQAIKKIKKNKNILSSIVIKGEISNYLAKKYLKRNKIIADTMNIQHLLTDNFISVNKNKGIDIDKNIVFTEKFQAEVELGSDENIINILKDKELLYPVAFAVRKEDYSLRNFINLKLLEIKSDHENSGILGFVLDQFNQNLKKYEKYKEFIEKQSQNNNRKSQITFLSKYFVVDKK